ncbi:hypothetical protein B296_00028539 [Ensete ventricosum]|uniref:Uncharacterized protein n=1 Tax=Ensete ventricosum TaxID=4639 RepID=A0A426ZIT3_ENSVE|nr:hypothetical protein B296_00028539 [Ensete ventricosum]
MCRVCSTLEVVSWSRIESHCINNKMLNAKASQHGMGVEFQNVVSALSTKSTSKGHCPLSLDALFSLSAKSQPLSYLAASRSQPCLCQLLGTTLLLSTPPVTSLQRLLDLCLLPLDLISLAACTLYCTPSLEG